MYSFTNPANYPYRKGMLYLGRDPSTGQDCGVFTERHAITIAGARSGKGAAVIGPNLLRWPHNVLCIDPSGENVAMSWQAREAMGQTVGVLDPFRVADVPARLRVSCNLLASISADAITAREDIRAIADGLVMRHKADDATWDNGAVSVLAGVIAAVLTDDRFPDDKNLPAVRQLLTLPEDARAAMFEGMAEMTGYGNLARAASVIGLSKSKKNMEFVGGAVDHSEWLDSEAMASILTNSTFELSALKTGRADLFLVLPPEYLAEHGRFLRLFVRCALNAMTKGGKDGQKCLFLLDEFFSLGRIDEIAKAAGLLPKNGVHLWPILQDLGQLTSLYGREGAHTFFGNSDVHMFFGNTDGDTLDYVSKRIGAISPREIPDFDNSHYAKLYPEMPAYEHWMDTPTIDRTRRDYREHLHDIQRIEDRARSEHNRVTGQFIGRPRFAAEEVRELVGKKSGDTVARSMIVFAKGGDVLRLKLAPYFEPPPPLKTSPPVSPHITEIDTREPAYLPPPYAPWKRLYQAVASLIMVGIFGFIFWVIAGHEFAPPWSKIAQAVVIVGTMWLLWRIGRWGVEAFRDATGL